MTGVSARNSRAHRLELGLVDPTPADPETAAKRGVHQSDPADPSARPAGMRIARQSGVGSGICERAATSAAWGASAPHAAPDRRPRCGRALTPPVDGRCASLGRELGPGAVAARADEIARRVEEAVHGARVCGEPGASVRLSRWSPEARRVYATRGSLSLGRRPRSPGEVTRCASPVVALHRGGVARGELSTVLWRRHSPRGRPTRAHGAISARAVRSRCKPLGNSDTSQPCSVCTQRCQHPDTVRATARLQLARIGITLVVRANRRSAGAAPGAATRSGLQVWRDQTGRLRRLSGSRDGASGAVAPA